jgi:cold shock CspA family protein
MAATNATGTVKGFKLIPPLPAENLSKLDQLARESMDQYILRKNYAVVTPDGETSEVLCEFSRLSCSDGLSIGDKVSYMVESPSAKFGTEITKIS